jgi:DNA modification methylase
VINVLHGDCRTVLPTLAAGRFRCAVTSPPYLWQRKYLPEDHADAAMEIGREPSIPEYVGGLVGVFREVRRVLADDGTLWINIGDGHANDGKWGGATGGKHRASLHGSTGVGRERHRTDLPPKCLMGIPWRLALALIDDGWTLRADIIWDTPNAMPEGNVRDRPTISHEYVFLFSKGPSYFYDQDALREPHTMQPQRRKVAHKPSARPGQPPQTFSTTARDEPGVDGHPLGRNARSVWSIQTEPGDGEHVAPMPATLARRCVLAGSKIGDDVLDPFGGSGTVGRVAEDEGRHATLIDLDESACAQARARGAQTGLFSRGAL